MLWFACDQVMDDGINRKVSNMVPEYLRKISMPGGHVRLGTVINSERAINVRFKHAPRRARVPHKHPGYARHTPHVFDDGLWSQHNSRRVCFQVRDTCGSMWHVFLCNYCLNADDDASSVARAYSQYPLI